MDEIRYLESNGLPTLHDPTTGIDRVLASLPPNLVCSLPDFGNVAGQVIIPQSEWQETDYSHFACPQLDQGRLSACGGFSTATTFTRAWIADGNPLYRFSPCFVYGLCNGGKDEGCTIEALLQAMMSTGICFESEVANGNIFKQNFPQQAFKTASRFKIAKAERCPTFDAIGSAIMQGRMVVLGIAVGRAFNNVDAGGVAPPPSPGERGGGHAMAAHRISKITAGPFAGQWGIEIQNSWGSRWGKSGKAFLVRQHFEQYCDAFAIKAAKDDPQDTSGLVAS